MKTTFTFLFAILLAAGLTSSRAENTGAQKVNLDGINDSSCAVPTNPYATDITDSSATLKWDAVPGATGYEVRYKVKGDTIWTYRKITTGRKRKLTHLAPNTTYTWEVKTFCSTHPPVTSSWTGKQTFTTSAVKLAESLTETPFDVYPNPFNSSSVISFSLAEDAQVQIQLVDITGRKLQTVMEQDLSSGNHEALLNRGHLNAGIYFLQLKMKTGSGPEEVMTKKLVIE